MNFYHLPVGKIAEKAVCRSVFFESPINKNSLLQTVFLTILPTGLWHTDIKQNKKNWKKILWVFQKIVSKFFKIYFPRKWNCKLFVLQCFSIVLSREIPSSFIPLLKYRASCNDTENKIFPPLPSLIASVINYIICFINAGWIFLSLFWITYVLQS